MEYSYDAFIIHSSRDEEWVCETLLAILEDNLGFRCCVPCRDFLPGKPVLENVTDSVSESRNIISVVSHHFLESGDCIYDLNVAFYMLSRRPYGGVPFVIKTEDVDIPKRWRKGTIIDCSTSTGNKRWIKMLLTCLNDVTKQGSYMTSIITFIYRMFNNKFTVNQ